MNEEQFQQLQRHYSTAPGCPGTSEYGHGMSRTTAHSGGCCDAWAQAHRYADDAAYQAAQARPILDWLDAGNSLGEAAPFGDWWLYRADHQPGQARRLSRESL